MSAVTIEEANRRGGSVVEATPDVACLRLSLVNVCFVGRPNAGDGNWVLIDTGMSMSRRRIRREALARFGGTGRPAAIVMTHAHFDHAGSVEKLSAEWDVPVYAHAQELPFLTGRADYPPPDPSVGGGLLAWMSPLFSRRGVNVGSRAELLPLDGGVPALPDWRWVPVPGHTPGQIAFFRESDRTLIAGDAFVTVKQESLSSVLAQRPKVRRPPAYFTTNWQEAGDSVARLADLRPATAVTGHGLPMAGDALKRGLDELVEHFGESVPRQGRYVAHPVG